MKKNLVILHGLGLSPEEYWCSSLAKAARKLGYDTYVPHLPHSTKPNLQETYTQLLSSWKVNEETIFIGHSSGATLVLGTLQKLPHIPVKKAILVAGFVDPFLTKALHRYVPRSDYDDLFPKRWNWRKIRENTQEFVVIHSTNDPYVQLRHAKILGKKLGTAPIFIEKMKHFSRNEKGERFKDFPLLLRYL